MSATPGASHRHRGTTPKSKSASQKLADVDFYSDNSSEIGSIGSDSVPERNTRNFEFTDGSSVMRVVRTVVFIQIIALMFDNAALTLPVLFRIFIRGVLFYSLRFYSRPFIDVIYVLQYFFSRINALIGSITLPSAGSANSATSQIPHRMLSVAAGQSNIQVDFLSPRNWHAIQHFGHYFFGIMFIVLVVLFTIKFWEITDYTDRLQIRDWLEQYIADGYWRKGGLHIAIVMLRASGTMAMVAMLMFAFARQMNVNAIPEGRMVGAAVATVSSVVIIMWFIGVQFLRATESAFLRYVSQNVSYTSTIILKRVVKCKIELGIAFMFLLYGPVLYNLSLSLLVNVDWNVNMSPRKVHNYYIPCYFMAFPPFGESHMNNDTCPVTYASSPDYRFDDNYRGLYKDLTILPCDSYLCLCFYTVSTCAIGFVICGYGWLFYSMITTTEKEFKESRWTQPLLALLAIRNDEISSYQKNYPFLDRFFLDLEYVFAGQVNAVGTSVKFFIATIIGFAEIVFWAAFLPITCCIDPIMFISSRICLIGCNSCTMEGRRRKELANIHSSVVAAHKSNRHNMAEITDYDEEAEAARLKLRTYTEIALSSLYNFISRLSICIVPSLALHTAKVRLENRMMQSETLAYVKVGYRHTMSVILRRHEELSMSVAGIGGAHAAWRIGLKSRAKKKSILTLLRRISEELIRSRNEFVTDHALTVTVFDRVIDSSGLFVLLCQYRLHRLRWSFVLWIEITLYTLVSAAANYYFNWTIRVGAICALVAFFGILTWAYNPFTDEVDQWLDIIGRAMVIACGVGTYICHSVNPNPNEYATSIYTPWKTFVYLKSLQHNNLLKLAIYLLVDAVMVLFVYFYVIYLLKLIGAYNYLLKKFNALKFVFHDKVLDFLVLKLDERTVGVENLYSGHLLLQQWDDIVQSQRRYAMLTWPDVRPQTMLPMSIKMLEVKWAAAFNLTLTNLRSSLGLSILHTAMCSAESEVTRWLIKKYPELMTAEDFQRDTPIMIALKECSYFLIRYGELNNGVLDDGTSYSDEDFEEYYPEILETRDNVAMHGEFVREFADIYVLDSRECNFLREHGYLIETKDTNRKDVKPSFMAKREAGKKSIQEMMNGSYVSAEDQMLIDAKEAKAQTKLRRKQAAQAAELAAREKQSLFAKRFPEDEFQDDFESGQMSSWKIIGLEVPNVNLFICKGDNWHEDPDLGEPAEDLKYYIPSTKPVETDLLDEVPESHPLLDDLHDWDTSQERHKKKLLMRAFSSLNSLRGRGGGGASTTGDGDDHHSHGGNTASIGGAHGRVICHKICKFSEIFMSEEVTSCGNVVKWNVEAYKELNKLASAEQGRISQSLAMTVNLNPPEGFSRISEWSLGISKSMFDEHILRDDNPILRATLAVVNAAEVATTTIANVDKVITKAIFKRRNLPGGSRHRPTEDEHTTQPFSDRVIHYFAECLVSSRKRLTLIDCELGVYGRVGWRAIVRAMRRKNSTFILPSMFVSPKENMIIHLELCRNEFDCGDCVLISDCLLYQHHLKYVDLSYNRIGCHGMLRLIKILRVHENLATFRIDFNRIGPSVGKELGLWLKHSTAIKVLSMSNNRMGELVRYPNMLTRERIPSAARDIFFGIRYNKGLQMLDLSYNNLGPQLADCVPLCVCRHATLNSLNLSGNNIGSEKGANLIYALAGEPGGEKIAAKRIQFVKRMKESKAKKDDASAVEELESLASQFHDDQHNRKEKKKMKNYKVNITAKTDENEEDKNLAAQISDIGLADNQLGYMAGYALASLVQHNKALTSLDVSRNSLSHIGGEAFTDSLEKCFGIAPRDFFKQVMDKIEEEKFQGRNAAVRKKVYTNLMTLNVARNNMGPNVISGLMLCLSAPACTITDLDVSDNPLGYSIQSAGDALTAGNDSRFGLGACKSLTSLDISYSHFQSTQLVPMFGGLSLNRTIRKLEFRDVKFDEPTCLQCAHALHLCLGLTHIDLQDCKMGPKGASLIVNRIESECARLTFVNLSGNALGPTVAVQIGVCLSNPHCAIETLFLANNELMPEGSEFVIRGLIKNGSVTDLDMSMNFLNASSAQLFGLVAGGLFVHGRKIADCNVRRLAMNNNPDIGSAASVALLKGLVYGLFEHIELANIGAGPASAKLLATSVRDVALAWKYCDFTGNNFGRDGLNALFWALRQNRRMRVFLCGDNKAGPKFGTDEDALLSHGVSISRMLTANVTLRELDLSSNGLCSAAACNILDSLCENFTIRKVSLRKNLFDDEMAGSLLDFLRCNNVVEDLDLGENRLGFACCFSLAEGMENNRSIKTLLLDNNRLGNAGTATLDAFARSFMMNTCLLILSLDSNKLGPEWGFKLADLLSRNDTLVQVSLRDNRFNPACGRCLVNAFVHAPLLLEVALTADEIGQFNWEEFRIAYNSKRAICAPEDMTVDTEIKNSPVKINNTYG